MAKKRKKKSSDPIPGIIISLCFLYVFAIIAFELFTETKTITATDINGITVTTRGACSFTFRDENGSYSFGKFARYERDYRFNEYVDVPSGGANYAIATVEVDRIWGYVKTVHAVEAHVASKDDITWVAESQDTSGNNRRRFRRR